MGSRNLKHGLRTGSKVSAVLGGSAPVDTWTVLFTDLVGSTQIRSRLGEEAFDRVRSDHDELMRSVVSRHRGAVVKFMGDGVMAVFGGASPALSCACDLQRSVEHANLRAGEPIHIRVGLSMGDAIVDGDDLHGIAVVEARRLCDAAGADEILCSAVVRQAAGSRGGHRFGPVTNRDLKGLAEPLLTCPLEWRLDGAPSTPAGLRIGVFGGIALVRDGQQIDLGGPKERAVLAALIAADGQPVSTDSLIDAVWRDDPPRSATRTIHAYIARLRGALGGGSSESVLFTRGRAYVLDLPTDAVDERRFVAGARRGRQLLDQSDGGAACLVLDEALREWSGQPYDGYEEIDRCAAAIRRLEEVRRAAIEDRFDALLDLGHAGDLVAEITAAVDDDPVSERRWGQLMLALYRSGRQADALRAYRRVRTVLAEELGVEPGPQLRELEAAILRHDTDRLHGSGHEPTVALPAALDPAGRAMFGRSDELERLRSTWSEAMLGTGAIMSVVGPEGIGKSRLVAELAASAHDAGAVVMYARCDADHRTARALFDQAFRSAGSSLLRTQSDALPGERLGVSIARRLTTWAADRPVLVVVDDLNLAEGEVLEVVADAAGAAARAPVLFLPLFRTDGGDAAPPPVGAQLPLSGLGREATAAIAALYRDDWSATDIDHLHGATGGVPLAVHERASAIARGAAAGRVEEAADAAGRATVALVSSQEAVADEVLGIRRLLARRRRELGGRVDTSDVFQTATTDECPFRGLRAFDVDDAEWFFGRERSVAQVVAQLAANSTVAVVGASGSGKSSLVRAGVLPTLAAGVLPGSESWRPVVLTPGVDPVAALTVVHGAGGSSADRLVVVIDQFEELFTAPSDDARERFTSEIAELTASGAALIVAIRADQFARLADVPSLSRLLVGSEVLIGPPTERELRDVVAGPAAHGGLQLDEGLVDEIIADSRGSGAVLPLVQTALLETWVRRDGATLTIEGYRESGGVRGAVARLAESAYGSLSPPEQRAAWRILLRLADASEDGSFDRRRRVPMTELMRRDDRDGRLAVDRLVESRLLTLSGDAVEVTHEALFREWPRLRRWLDEDLQGRRLHQRLGEAARSWAASGRDPSELLRGTRLAAADEWADRHVDELNDIESELLDASRAEMRHELLEAEARADREATANRRLRRRFAATAMLAVLALVTGAVALTQRNRAQDAADAAEAATATAEIAADQAEDARASEAEARGEAEHQADRFATERDAAEVARLVAESERATDGRLDLGLLLAVEARRRADTVETRGAMLTALTQSRPERAPGEPLEEPLPAALEAILVPGWPTVTALKISGDGSTIVAGGSRDGRPEVAAYAIDSGRALRRIGGPTMLDIDPTGTFVLAAGERYASLYAIRGGTDRTLVDATAARIESVGLSPDGATAAVVFNDQTARFYSTRTGEPLDVPPPPGPVDLGDFTRQGWFSYGGIDPALGTAVLHQWDVEHGTMVRTTELETVDVWPQTYAFSPDGQLLVGVTPWSVFVWDLASGAMLDAIDDIGPLTGAGGVFVADRTLALTRDDGSLLMYNLAARGPAREPVAAKAGSITAIDASTNLQRLVSSAADGRIRVWGSDDRGPLMQPVDGVAAITMVAGDGNWYSRRPAETDGEAAGFDELVPTNGSAAPVRVELPALPYQRYQLSYDARYITYAGSDAIGKMVPVEVVDTATGEVVWRDDTTWADRALVGPDGRHLILLDHDTDEPGGMTMIDLETGGVIAERDESQMTELGGAANTLQFSPDGRYLEIAYLRTGRLLRLDANTLEIVSDLTLPFGPQQGIAAVADSDLRYVPGTSGILARVDLASGDVEIARSSDATTLVGAMLSPDGTLVAVRHQASGAVALFDTATLRPLGRPIPLGVSSAWMAFTPDGDMIANTSFGVARIELDPEVWQETACRVAGRNLTHAEWREYLGDEPYRATCPRWPAQA